MKPTQFLDAVRNIRKRLVSYLSIMITAIMGVSGLLCIFFMGISFNRYAAGYYREHHFKDLEIVSSMGISDENLRMLSDLEGVRYAEGAFDIDGYLRKGDTSIKLTLLSVTEQVSVPQILDGVMPKSETECALSRPLMEKAGLQIGDQITLDTVKLDTGTQAADKEQAESLLKGNTFTITGTCIHPDYFTSDTNNIALLPVDAFDRTATADGYLQALLYLDMDDSIRQIQSPSYDAFAKGMEKRIRDYTGELSRVRTEEISAKAWDEYDQKEGIANDQLEAGFKKMKDGEQELFGKESDAKAKLSGALDDLTGSELKFSDGVRQILDGEQKYQDGLLQIENAKAQLAAGRAQLDQGYAQFQYYTGLINEFSPLLEELDLMEPVNEEVAAGEAQLAAGEAQYQQGVAALNRKIAEADLPGASARIDAALEKMKQGREQLDNGWIAYEEKRLEADTGIAEGYQKLDDGKAEYTEKKEDAENKLEEGRHQVETVEEARFLVLNRQINTPYVEFSTMVDEVNGFGYIFIPLFALVLVLVIYSTMAIIIDEQKKQIGALKALGFRTGEIRNKYLIFGLSATVFGVIGGSCLSLLLEDIILDTVDSQFIAGDLPVVFHPVIAAVMGLSTLFVALLVVWISCRGLLKATAVGLISGSEPAKRTLKKSSGKDRSLYSQLIIRNIVTELPRVFVSIVVILASCLLIGVGFAMNLAFNRAFERQEKNIYRYNMQILLNDDEDAKTKEQEKTQLEAAMNTHNIRFLPMSYSSVSYETETKSGGFFLLCADQTQLKSYVDISVDIPDSGILVPEKFMETHVFSDQQTMTIYDRKLIAHEGKVSGSFPFYVGFVAVLGPSAYEEIFGEKPDWNGYYCAGEEQDLLAFKEEVEKAMPSVTLQSNQIISDKYKAVKDLFNLVSLIMVLIAGIITFMVMINLNSILVNRRMKELLIMKINGFNHHQVIGYLLRDTMMVNLIGIVIGLAIGLAFNYTLIHGIEAADVMYVRQPSFLAWGAAAAINILFAVIINSISFRRVRHIELTDITKY